MYFIFVDIIECVFWEYNNCHPNANCTDTVGSYTCECKDGYTGDGVTCTSMYFHCSYTQLASVYKFIYNMFSLIYGHLFYIYCYGFQIYPS